MFRPTSQSEYHAALVYIGISLGFFYYLAFGINFAFLYGGGLSNAYSWIATVIFSTAALSNFNLCFISCITNTNRFFNIYNTIAFLAAICAFINGFIFYSISGFGSILYFWIFGLSSFLLCMTCVAKTKIRECREERMNQYVEAQGPTIVTTSENTPKFDMPVTVERAEVRDHPETEQVNEESKDQ